MTKPLSSKIKSQRELMRKRESAKLAAVKKRQEKDRKIRQKRLDIEERKRLLREQKWRLGDIQRERAEQSRREKREKLRESLDTRLTKKKRFGTEKVGKRKKKGVPFYKRKMKVRGKGVKLSQFLGG